MSVGLISFLLLLISLLCNAAPPAVITEDSNSLVLSNSYVRFSFNKNNPQIDFIGADFSGNGQYKNIVSSGTDSSLGRKGWVLEREDGNGQVHASSASKSSSLAIKIITNTTALVSAQITGIIDDATSPTVTESWTLSLATGERYLTLQTSGSVTRQTTVRAIRHACYVSPTSLYAIYYDRGVVQMMNDNNQVLASVDNLNRIYFIGNQMSLELLRPNNTLSTVVLSTGAFFSAGFQEILLGKFSPLDSWVDGWHNSPNTTINVGQTYSSYNLISPNNYDFPTLSPLGTTALSTQPNLPFDDLRALITGIYSSSVGCAASYDKDTPAEYAPTLHTPDTSYSGLYNFFDPDGYFQFGAMLYSGDPALQNEARKALERNGDYLKSTGQLPHHFVGNQPDYEAISGATQTGPNLFWSLTCLQYAKVTGDIEWLRGYRSKLELSNSFLLSFYDDNIKLVKAPGPLWIDVFIRENYTSDTNGIFPYLLEEMALMEDLIGDANTATQYRTVANNIISAYNNLLWNTTSDDHYITQRNPNNTTRDFVDYDSNLLAIAFNVAPDDRALRALKRVDGGKCMYPGGKMTWVSEVYYGASDCYNGNTGDSATAMGRIGWADLHARVRMNQLDIFNGKLEQVKSDLLAKTWLTERYDCNGNLIRSPYYHEYDDLVAMALREMRYGINLHLASITIQPYGVSSYNYHIGNVNVDYSATSVILNLPGPSTITDNTKTIQIYGLTTSRTYNIQVTGSANLCTSATLQANTDSTGLLVFKATVNNACTITATRS